LEVKAFENIVPRERNQIIKGNGICPFCLMHGKEERGGLKGSQSAPSQNAKGEHIQWLHEILIF
jgi:hypothetical protein